MILNQERLEVFKEYLRTHYASINTKKTYSQYAKLLLNRDVTEKTIPELYTELGQKPMYLAVFKAVNRCFKLRIDFELARPRGRSKSNEEMPVKYLTSDQIMEIIEYYNSPDKTELIVLILLMYENGLRVSEALSITKENVFDNHTQIKTIGKGNKPFITKVSKDVTMLLKNIIETQNFKDKDAILIYSPNKSMRHKVRYDIQKACLKLNIRTNTADVPTSHDLRHSFGSRLVQLGFNLREVQKMLRHSKLETVKRYTAVQEREQLENRKIGKWGSMIDINEDDENNERKQLYETN